ncbi:VirK/YbjX family protein [Photobacterium damselae]|uniref:VirK/YbjX family protein n=1 Tax=Photobacterium damselae TaxID=38293 RepID=UPI003709C83A
MSSLHSSTYKQLCILSQNLHADSTGFKKVRQDVRFKFWGLMHQKTIKNLLQTFDNETLSPVLSIHPKIIKKPFKSYICAKWNTQRRVSSVQQHFQFLQHNFHADALPAIFTADGYQLAEVTDQEENIYRLFINRGQQREGSLGLSLLNSKGNRIYATTVNFETTPYRTMYIGVIQGPNEGIENRQQVIKSLTKSCHGLRPKALILEFALMLARCLNVTHIYGISNQGHIYKSWRYIGRKRSSIVTFDYDAYWQEYGAIQIDKSFYLVPTQPERKDLSQLNRNKRKLYTKRYAWLDELEQNFCQNLTPLKK